MGKRRTPESYREEVAELTSGEYEVLGDFVNARTSIIHRHNSCGQEWSSTPDKFTQGRRCPTCAIAIRAEKKRRSHEDYCEIVRKLGAGQYEVIGNYTDSQVLLLHRHNPCGHEWYIKPGNFTQGKRCPKCAISIRADKRRVGHEAYCEIVRDLVGEEYSVLGQYVTSNTKILHIHNTCGYKWRTTPGSFRQGHGCPKCAIAANASKQRKSHEVYCEEVRKQVGDEYAVLGEYKNADTPIQHRHNTCGYEWNAVPDGFINRGTRCPRCNESKGERRVSEVLDDLGIMYTREFTFDDCRSKRPLRFDFALHFGDSVVLVEYDGEQHFLPVKGWGGDKALAKVQRRDRIKTEYCRANGIPLIRIAYTQYDEIEEVLTSELTKNDVIDANRQRIKTS